MELDFSKTDMFCVDSLGRCTTTTSTVWGAAHQQQQQQQILTRLPPQDINDSGVLALRNASIETLYEVINALMCSKHIPHKRKRNKSSDFSETLGPARTSTTTRFRTSFFRKQKTKNSTNNHNIRQ